MTLGSNSTRGVGVIEADNLRAALSATTRASASIRKRLVLTPPDKALLVRPKVGNVLLDLLPLGAHPFHGRDLFSFKDITRHTMFNPQAVRERRRFFDQRIKFGFPIGLSTTLLPITKSCRQKTGNWNSQSKRMPTFGNRTKRSELQTKRNDLASQMKLMAEHAGRSRVDAEAA